MSLQDILDESIKNVQGDARRIDDQIVADFTTIYNAAYPAFIASEFGQWLRMQMLKRSGETPKTA